MLDWRGTEIKPGSIVIYPGRQGAHQWMIEAKVISIEERDHWGRTETVLKVQPVRQGSYGRTNYKPVGLTALERVTVIKECTEHKESSIEDWSYADANI
jgi:hypothetical protein